MAGYESTHSARRDRILISKVSGQCLVKLLREDIEGFYRLLILIY